MMYIETARKNLDKAQKKRLEKARSEEEIEEIYEERKRIFTRFEEMATFENNEIKLNVRKVEELLDNFLNPNNQEDEITYLRAFSLITDKFKAELLKCVTDEQKLDAAGKYITAIEELDVKSFGNDKLKWIYEEDLEEIITSFDNDTIVKS